MTVLHTTLGAMNRDELGLILPHEHLFVDLRLPDTPGFAEATEDEVVAKMAPEVERAKSVGVTALVECSPVGVGRRAEMDLAISLAAQFPVVVPTGIYREPWIPQWAQQASEDDLCFWMLDELTDGIEMSGVRAAWIKISAGDDGITDTEARILRAAARAGKKTGAVIGSHTIRGRVVKDQLAIIEEMGYSPDRYIWIHTQAEPDFNLHLEMAKRGVWIEYDALGNPDAPSDEAIITMLRTLLDNGHEKILLSHDRGWFDPGNRGDPAKPFTYLSEVFLPKLVAAGFDDATIRMLTEQNPFDAFAR
jgi:phosphotriesterase-related protein